MCINFGSYRYIRMSHQFFCHIKRNTCSLAVGAELFAEAVEETDESLKGEVAARAEKIEVDKDIDIDERRR